MHSIGGRVVIPVAVKGFDNRVPPPLAARVKIGVLQLSQGKEKIFNSSLISLHWSFGHSCVNYC